MVCYRLAGQIGRFGNVVGVYINRRNRFAHQCGREWFCRRRRRLELHFDGSERVVGYREQR